MVARYTRGKRPRFLTFIFVFYHNKIPVLSTSLTKSLLAGWAGAPHYRPGDPATSTHLSKAPHTNKDLTLLKYTDLWQNDRIHSQFISNESSESSIRSPLEKHGVAYENWAGYFFCRCMLNAVGCFSVVVISCYFIIHRTQCAPLRRVGAQYSA
jgi:hypothetical protein